MEREDIVSAFAEFLKEYYYKDLAKAVTEGKRSLAIDFKKLDRFNPELADLLLEEPEETIQLGEKALEEIDLPQKPKDFRLRFFNLPESRNVRIRNLRVEHLGKFLVVDGIVKRATEVRPEVAEAIFECPECGNRITVIQTEKRIKPPTACECGAKRGFKLVDQRLYDARWIVVEEPFEITSGERPSELTVYLKEDLTEPRMQNKTDPGNRIKIVGILKQMPRVSARRGRSRQLEIYLDANYVESVETEWEEIEISPEDEKRIKELAKDPHLFEKLVGSIAPTIYGMDEVKEAIVLQLFGGETHYLKDGTRIRGEIHILLIGDPASGKSRLMQLASKLIPRGRYVSGRGVTGAGLTATVMRDEQFFGGWVLEAGALIMANRSLLAIDEFSKVSQQDQVALQEAMSLGSYHPDTVITLLDGTQIKIKELVESILENHKNEIRYGEDCLWVNLKDGPEILTTDFFKIKPGKIRRVSKHTAPPVFYRIRISTGKELVVTPDHPCFVLRDGEIKTVRADELTTNDWVPIPSHVPLRGAPQKFFSDTSEIRRTGAKHITLPLHNSPDFCRLMGYIASEGCGYASKNKEYGICFTNGKEILLRDFKKIMRDIFGLEPKVRKREGRTMLFYNSVELWNFLKEVAPGLLQKAWEKSLPEWVTRLPGYEISHLLRAAFDGDATFTDGKVKYTTTSERLAYQIQDLLHVLGIISYVRERKTVKGRECFDVIVSGKENLKGFLEKIGFSDAKKNREIESYIRYEKPKPSLVNVVPNVQSKVKNILKKLKVCQKEVVGYVFTDHVKRRYNFTVDVLKRVVRNLEDRIVLLELVKKDVLKVNSRKALRKLRKKARVSTFQLARRLGVCHQTVSYWEIKAKNFPLERYKKVLIEVIEEMLEVREDVETLKKLAFGEIRWSKIVSIEKVRNNNVKWVYDVTTENGRFVSNGMVLHNTVSIAKASIVATLPAMTSILAGGNPKLGRFDPYIPIREQIDISDVLLSRFDLKFALRDVPNPELDAKMADHILRVRHFKEEESKPVIEPEFLRKYIAYARAHVHPKLTREAGERLREFYIKMRSKASGGEAPVPITLRQYEALIRLAEASAKARLSNKVTVEDAERAIRLMKVSLRQFGFDPETGMFDIDRAEGALPASQRSKMRTVLDVIEDLEKSLGKVIPEAEVIKRAKDAGVEDIEEIIKKMKAEGVVFSPKPGFIQKV